MPLFAHVVVQSWCTEGNGKRGNKSTIPRYWGREHVLRVNCAAWLDIRRYFEVKGLIVVAIKASIVGKVA